MMTDQTERVTASIRDELESLCARPSSNCCIYKVPECVCQGNEEAYRPLVMSIGPFYSQDPRLQLKEIQEQKLRCLQDFLRLGSNNAYNRLDHYISYVREHEQEAREFYAEDLSGLPSDNIIRMLLLDAAFIIMLFLSFSWDSNEYSLNHHNRLLFPYIWHDIFLQDNQLPFFILNGLFELASGTDFTLRICGVISRNFGFERQPALENIRKYNQSSSIRHLIDFVRICFLPFTLRDQHLDIDADIRYFPISVSELSDSGVKFKASQNKNLLDVRFVNGVLEIPKIRIQDTTDSLYRSIMVFEQCHCFDDSYFLDYVYFLDWLISTPKDAQILVNNGIIENFLGSNEKLAEFFNQITKNSSINDAEFYYNSLCGDLKTYASKRRNKWRTSLKNKYFINHPWATVSVIYAVVLLILTILQTISGFTSKN